MHVCYMNCTGYGYIHANAVMQAYLYLLETVGAAASLGLGQTTFLPDLYIDILVSCSLIGRLCQALSAENLVSDVWPCHGSVMSHCSPRHALGEGL